MNSNLLIIILPLIALVIAGLSIVGLWYWWVSTKDEEETAEGEDQPLARLDEDLPSVEQSIEQQLAELDQEPQGSFFDRLVDSLRPLPTPPTSSTEPPPPASSYVTPSPTPEMPPPQNPRPQPVMSKRPPAANTVEVMRILRDLADGSLVVEINGRYYYHPEDINDPEIGRRFNGVMQALSDFAEPGDFEIPDEWLEPPSKPVAAAAPSITPDEVPLPSSWQTAQSTPPPPSRKTGFFQRGSQTGDEPIPEARPMTEQIEELLQYRLSISPGYAHRSIHVRPTADGSVRIEVDGRFYEGVGAVDDPEIQAFLRETIRQWEARQ